MKHWSWDEEEQVIKRCENCKYERLSVNETPCRSCEKASNWKYKYNHNRKCSPARPAGDRERMINQVISAGSGTVEHVVLKSYIKDQLEHAKNKRESDVRGSDWWQSRINAFYEILNKIRQLENT